MSIVILANIIFMYSYTRNYLKNNQIGKNKKILLLCLYILILSIYTLLFFKLDNKIELLYLWTISTVLMLVIFTDLIYMVIPDNLILLLVGITILYHIINYILRDVKPDILFYLSGCILSGLIFVVIYLVSKGGIGQGDITLISSIGLILGPYNILLNVMLSFFLGALISIFLLVTKIKNLSDPIPFGPFIIIGFFITKLYGNQIIDWYISLL